MFLLRKPSDLQIRAFITAQRQTDLSYSPMGITRDAAVAGYTVDHNRVQLGSGAQCFDAAVAAIRRWKMFDLGWVNLVSNETSIEAGETVAVVINHLGFWSMNACRIVYVIEEQGRYGFAYGTLAEHAERGEERFMVEWKHEDDTVWYDILALSQPGPMARLGYPFTRRLQKRFARDSKEAMKRAVVTKCSQDK
ncbi:MAG TPA: DUF1990 domain-containing protein [Pyrinomonadaceae bacterium]|nr:DUF1990 domain-containing protein [Pyrinomonadaceae bacterium]